MDKKLTMEMVKDAAGFLAGVAHYTPLDYSSTLSSIAGGHVYLKLENLQKTGSFKIRGAYCALAGLTGAEKKRGVIAASAGNHAQGVAYAASRLGMKSTIVMPAGAPMTKITATRRYGAEVILAGNNYDEAYLRAMEIQKESGAVYIHGFDDYRIMAGQGTLALELLEQLPGLDMVVVPVGGGGLISGLAFAMKQLKPGVKVVGVQAEGAPAALESKRAGKLVTVSPACAIADGIAVGRPGYYTFKLLCEYVDDIVTVSDREICSALLFLLERSKLVVEGAGAVGVAGLLRGKIACAGRNVAVILTGGNIDSNLMPVIIEKGLIEEGRRWRVNCFLPDTPGSLQKLLAEVSRSGSNVISIAHDRVYSGVPLKKARVEMVLETRDNNHISKIKVLLEERGYLSKDS